jgi:hypothetical protein
MKKRLLLAVVVLTGMFLLSASIVWAWPAPVAKTGQTTSYRTGDDGDHELGVASPSPRFTDNGDGTVRDNLTGLMWAKDANLNNGEMTWNNAIDYANNLSLGSTGCGGTATDWRLPNHNELLSLIDKANESPAMPTGHPFSNIQGGHYWTSTTRIGGWNIDQSAWVVAIGFNGVAEAYDKIFTGSVLPVRSGN